MTPACIQEQRLPVAGAYNRPIVLQSYLIHSTTAVLYVTCYSGSFKLGRIMVNALKPPRGGIKRGFFR